MLRITSLKDATGRYLLDDPAREVADLFDGAMRGRWLGTAASTIGLEGRIEPEVLELVLSGRRPGGTITPSVRQRRAAVDLIFAAPKPASLLMASPDDGVARSAVLGHEEAVGAALGYLEDRAAGVIRQCPGGERVWLHAEGVVAAGFTHGASRSGDPHLHSHVLLANRARADDGRFGALDVVALRAHARAADAVYRAVLRSELAARLGVTFLRGADGAPRIEGISDGDCLALSGRSEEVRRGVLDRPTKVAQTRAEALERWSIRRSRVVSLDDPPRFVRSAGHLDEHRAAGVLHDRPLTARALVESVATAATSGMTVAAMGELLGRIEGPLGRGAAEVVLSPVVLPTWRNLARLGPRPTDRRELAWWLDEASRTRTRSGRAELFIDGVR